MKLDSNNHSVFSMYYHLVLVVKYRREVFDDKVSDFAKDMFVKLGEKYNISLVEWN
ncbi:IS200/IS605 family transposase, partial [Virgibacillus halodenitrificans]|nr:IS200/IS605 family transposase [Virgibacillus halodenitrificans]